MSITRRLLIKLCLVLLLVQCSSSALFATVHNPYPHEQYDEVVNPLMRTASDSMGMYFDAMKSFLIYTSAQHVPGTKESGVGYLYDNKTKKMERQLFWRVGNGYPRRTDRPLDFKINGKGFFVVELPGGWPAYTHDGRFELDENNRLVMQAHPFPVLGESGYIYLPGDDVFVTDEGELYYGDQLIDVLQVKWFKSVSKNLESFNQAIFHLSHEDFESGEKNSEPDYTVMQGYVEDSSITKGYIGLVPEWSSGHEGNVKVIKAYVKAMQLAIQQAEPR